MVKVWGMFTKLKEENRIMKTVVAVLALTVLLEGVFIYRMSTMQKIIVLPPEVNREFWVAGNTVSNSYLEQVALYVVDRLLSVSPENVESSFVSIMPLLTTEPELIKKIKSDHLEYARGIKTNNVYQMFYPLKVSIQKDSITVEGLLKKLTGNILMSESRTKVLLRYQIKNGRFFITEIGIEGER